MADIYSKPTFLNEPESSEIMGTRIMTWSDTTKSEWLEWYTCKNPHAQIQSLEINSSGTLMAVVEQTSITVLGLRTPGSSPKVMATLDMFLCNVVKAIWNPIALDDTCLVVLTSNNAVTTYNILPASEPHGKTYQFSRQPSQISDVSFTQSDQIVSICFGTEADSFGPMTLYALSKAGDIYGLCPFVPDKFVIAQDDIERMLDQSVEAYSQNANDQRFKLHYTEQLSWMSNVWRQVRSATVPAKTVPLRDGSSKSLFSVQSPTVTSPKLQGPFSSEPFPLALYEGEALDIAATPTKCMTVLSVAMSNQRVNFFLQDVSLDMQWESQSGNAADSNQCELSLALIESVDLTTVPYENLEHHHKKHQVAFAVPTKDPKPSSQQHSIPTKVLSGLGKSAGSNDASDSDSDDSWDHCRLVWLDQYMLYVLGPDTAFSCDIRPWAQPLDKTIETGDLSTVSMLLDSRINSIHTRLVPENNKSNIIGGPIIRLKNNEQFMYILTEDAVYPDSDANDKVDSNDSTTEEEPLGTVALSLTTTIAPSDKYNYHSLLDKPFTADGPLAEVDFDVPPAPRDVDVTVKLVDDLPSNRYFEQLSSHFGNQFNKLDQAGYLMHSRLRLQKSELFSQLEQITKLSKSLRSQQAPSDKVAGVIDRQRNLHHRVKKLLDDITKVRILRLSKQEEKWISELERLKDRLSTTKSSNIGLEQRVKSTIHAAKFVIDEASFIKQVDKSQKNESSRFKHNVNNLFVMLDNEEELLNTTKSELQAMLDTLNSRVKTLRITSGPAEQE